MLMKRRNCRKEEKSEQEKGSKEPPDKLSKLASCYSGDESWDQFANLFFVEKQNVQKITDTYNVSLSTAKVIEWHIKEENADVWFNSGNPLLCSYQPAELINEYINGENCVRAVLRRMK